MRTSIEEEGVTPEELKSYLMTLSIFSDSEKGEKVAIDPEGISKLNSISDIFDMLTEYSSFLNYDIFQGILKKYNIKEDREELKYSKHLVQYIKMKSPLKVKVGY